MEISELGVGAKAEAIFSGEGIKTLFPPQEQAVDAGLMNNKSLLVCTPTASGKTVIAELAALRSMGKGAQVVYLVPLRALASEKYRDFQKWEKLGFKVDLQMGDLDSKFLPQKNQADIVVATAEKCDSILRSRPSWFRDVGLLVIDEIHLIGTDRGPTYEILISKFKKLFPTIQLLGLSATIGNAEDLGDWLGAEVVRSDWRPVKLKQEAVQGAAKVLFDEVRKTAEAGAQSLVFVNSRRSAEAVSDKLSERMKKRLDEKTAGDLNEIAEEIESVLSPATAQCRRLANAVRGGAAFHHAGMVNRQRELVEDAFKSGKIKVISATPTLAAGINMPARKVIIRDIKRYTGAGMDYIPVLEYLQMVGRAGRPKYDKEGESVLLASTDYELEFLRENYLNGRPEAIHSQLGIEPVLRMHILASIASGFTRSRKELLAFFSDTFFAYEYGMGRDFEAKLDKIIAQLVSWEFIRVKTPGGGEVKSGQKDSLFVSAADLGKRREDLGGQRLVATPLGGRVAELYLDPETAHDFVTVFEDPQKTDKISPFSLLDLFASSTELRPLLRVKRSEEDEIWGLYYEGEEMLLTDETDSDYLDRFKTALMLNDWISERSEEYLLQRYGVAPGLLRIKLASAEWLAYSCAELVSYTKADHRIKRVLDKTRFRIKHGISEELLELASIKGIGRVRARSLYDSGIKSKSDLRQAERRKLESLLGSKVAEKVLRDM